MVAFRPTSPDIVSALGVVWRPFRLFACLVTGMPGLEATGSRISGRRERKLRFPSVDSLFSFRRPLNLAAQQYIITFVPLSKGHFGRARAVEVSNIFYYNPLHYGYEYDQHR